MILVSVTAVAVAVVASGVAEARQMHAGLDYHRYLAEKNQTRSEVDEWKAKFGDVAKANGLLPSRPASEERSIDDEDEMEDYMQRFFMTKQNITAMQALNPNANFSTDSPFSLMTNDEFSAWVGKSSRGLTGLSLGSGSSSISTTSAGENSVSNRRLHNDNHYATVTTTSSSASTTENAETAFSATDTDINYMDPSAMGQAVDERDFSFDYAYDYEGMGSDEVEGTVGPADFDESGWSSTWIPTWSETSPEAWSETEPATSPDAGLPTAPTSTAAPTPMTVTPTSTAAPTSATVAPTSTEAPSLATETPVATDTTSSASTTAVESTDSTSSVASDSDSVDWATSPCMSPVQTQGDCGNCWAFSAVAAVESAHCIANGQKGLTKFSEQQVTSCDSQNAGCNGGVPAYAMDFIHENGLCTEADYPYTSSDGTQASCVTGCSAVDTGVQGYADVTGESDLAARVAKQPVVLSVASGNAVWKQYTGGVVSACDTSEVDHGVVVVGYDDNAWKIRNSWGVEWGEEGYIRLERTSDTTGTCSMYMYMSYPTIDL